MNHCRSQRGLNRAIARACLLGADQKAERRTIIFQLDRCPPGVEQRARIAVVRRNPRERRRQQRPRRGTLLHCRLGRGVGRRHLRERRRRHQPEQQRAECAGTKPRAGRPCRHFRLPHGQIIPLSGPPCPVGGRSLAPLLVVLTPQEARNINPVFLVGRLTLGRGGAARQARHTFEQGSATDRACRRFRGSPSTAIRCCGRR